MPTLETLRRIIQPCSMDDLPPYTTYSVSSVERWNLAQ